MEMLDDLLKSGKITKAQYEIYKNIYASIHEVVIVTYSNEKALLEKAKELKAVLEGERTKLEQKLVQSQETQSEIEKLQKDEKEVGNEVQAKLHEKNIIMYELEELKSTKKDREKDLDDKYSATLAAMEPVVEKLTSKIQELNVDIQQQKNSYDKENGAVQEYLKKINASTEKAAAIEKLKLKKRVDYNTAVGEPERLKLLIEQIENQARELERDASTLSGDIRVKEEELNAVQKEKALAQQEIEGLGFKLDSFRIAIEKRKANIDDIQRAQDIERQKAEEGEEKARTMDMEKKHTKSEQWRYMEAANGYHKLCEQQKRDHERLRRKRDTVNTLIPPLTAQYEMLERQLKEMKYQHQMQKQLLLEIKQDEDLYISQYLQQDKLEDDTTAFLRGVENNKLEFEEKIQALAKEERRLQGECSKLSAQRELMAREASRATSQFRETKEDLKVKNMILLDLDKQTLETFQRLKLCSLKYEKMKNQRNKLANLTQSSSQALAEMKEKIKILQNEVEILRNESLARDRALAEEQRIHAAAKVTRDALRQEQAKKQQTLRKKKEEDEKQKNEADKLNSIVNGAEKQMIRLRTDYAQSVDSRNIAGIQLIDRNDELCILYEKSNIQQAILAKGDAELAQREEELRAQMLENAELQRKLDLANKRSPSLGVYAEATKQLEQVEQQLNEERELTKVLVEKLETPQLSHEMEGSDPSKTEEYARCRTLGGNDPEPEQLAAKIEVLEERLNDKKETLLEKELVLDEVSSLSDKLKLQAAESRGATLDLAKRVNDYQAQIRAVTRKMMANVSELSMYQATAMKLEHQRNSQEAELREARLRLQEGAPPSDDCEHEWYRMERDRVRRQEMMMERTRLADTQVEEPGVTRTTAEPRPNAYIPEVLGIPKPYGALAPFKPTTLGATMRHIRNPVIQEVQI